jgi:hypothetical protein
MIRDFFDNLDFYKLKNLGEMNEFLDTFDLQKLNQEDTEI